MAFNINLFHSVISFIFNCSAFLRYDFNVCLSEYLSFQVACSKIPLFVTGLPYCYFAENNYFWKLIQNY